MTPADDDWASHPSCIETRSRSLHLTLVADPPASSTPNLDEVLEWYTDWRCDWERRRAKRSS
jgi:hypothetical protein